MYIKTNAERASLLAILRIIKQGIQVGEHDNHKNRNFATVTFAERVIVAGEEGIMAVVVKKTIGNFYKVHRVFTPKGNTLEI